MRFRIRGLLMAAAASQLAMGLMVYLFPSSFSGPTYDNFRPYFPFLSSGLMAAGALLLLLARSSLPGWLRRAMGLVSAIPLAILASAGARMGMVSSSVAWSVLAVAVVVAPWLPVDQSGRWRLGLLTLAVTELALSGLMLLRPHAFTWLASPLPAGIVGLVGAVSLLLLPLQARGFRQALFATLGLLFPLFLSGNDLQLGHWHSLSGWIVWDLALVGVIWNNLAPGLAVAHAADEPELTPDSPSEVERMLELWSWFLVLVVLTISAIGQEEVVLDPVIIRLFAAGVSGYNAVMHLVMPHVGRSDHRVLAHLAFLSLAFGFLVSDGGHLGIILGALMVIPPFIATRVRGEVAGYGMLGGILVTLLVFDTLHGQRAGHDFAFAFGEAVIQLLVVGAAGTIGVRSAAQQHELVRELGSARTQLQRQVEQQALITRIGLAIRSSLNLHETLETTVNELGRALQVSRCYIRLSTPAGLTAILHQYISPEVEPLDEHHLPQLVLGPAVARARDVIAVDDVLKHADWRQMATLVGVRSVLAAPIQADGRFLGTIVFHQCNAPRAWTRQEIQFLEAVAGQVGVAIAHAGAHRDLEEQHRELQAVNAKLSTQAEELETQREALQAQNEELVSQGKLLAAQARQLAEALDAARTAEEAQARLIAILEATTDYVGMTDRHGRVLHLNTAARHLLGVPDHESLHLTIQQIFPPGFVNVVVRKAMREAMRRGHWSGEGMVLDKTGRELPVSLVIVAQRGQTGTTDFFATIARDISAQKASEAALRESEDRFRSAFDKAPIGMGLVDSNGHWMQVNPPLCEMLGYSEGDLLGTNALDLIHPEDVARAEAYAVQMLRGEIPSYQMEQRWFHRSGHTVWTLVSAALVRSPERGDSLVVHIQDISERKQVESQLLHLANYDPLTDLFNRRRFQEELEAHLANAIRYNTQGALLFLDLDQFKYINDSLGHQAGDQMLKSLASLLRRLLRKGDSIARLGGDEFAILLPHANASEAEAVAGKILDALRHHVEMIDGRPIGITGSLGVALFPDQGRTTEELLSFADMAMYKVKERGRNTYALYSPDESTRERLESKLTWEHRIRHALANNGFVLYQQPILNLRRGTIRRFEALLRMKNPDGTVTPPGQFLPIAERFGLIQDVDRWVVREAIHQIARQQQSMPDYCLEVNVSATSFADPELLPLIKREVEATGIDPSHLVLEITETAAGADTELGRTWVNTLRELGCRFALDDFGSGFSSFSYLKQLPVDYLKIDGGFIRNLPHSPVDQELVRAMVQVARGLGRMTIAESVEDGDTLLLLRDLGIDYAQGYHIGRPVPMTP